MNITDDIIDHIGIVLTKQCADLFPSPVLNSNGLGDIERRGRFHSGFRMLNGPMATTE